MKYNIITPVRTEGKYFIVDEETAKKMTKDSPPIGFRESYTYSIIDRFNQRIIEHYQKLLKIGSNMDDSAVDFIVCIRQSTWCLAEITLKD